MQLPYCCARPVNSCCIVAALRRAAALQPHGARAAADARLRCARPACASRRVTLLAQRRTAHRVGAVPSGGKPPPLSDSLAALDRLCGTADNAAAAQDECPAPAPAEAGATHAAPPLRRVELSLEDLDTGEPRLLTLELPVATAASRLVVCALLLPLGLVFEERDQRVVLAEVLEDGSAAALPASAPRPKVGDVLRATSACIIAMEYSGMNLLGGGNGRPRTRRVAYRVDDEASFGDQSFAQALAALKSNARAGRGDDVTLVLERGPTS